MGAADIISQNVGNIEKAIIEIIDMRKGKVEVEEGNNGGGVGLNDSFLNNAGNGGILMDHIASEGIQAPENATVKQYTVQFNPSSFSIRARGEGFMPVLSYGEKGSTVSPTKQSIRITVSMRLIFDEVDPADAFMQDKTNVSPTQIGQNVAKAVLTATGKKTIGVQKTVEGFIAALRNPNTRVITFHWGELNYSGVLNSVSAQYTMFNLQGQPVRAYLNLSLLCLHNNPTPNTLGPWEEAYKKAFGSGSMDAVRGTQSFGNLLNLG